VKVRLSQGFPLFFYKKLNILWTIIDGNQVHIFNFYKRKGKQNSFFLRKVVPSDGCQEELLKVLRHSSSNRPEQLLLKMNFIPGIIIKNSIFHYQNERILDARG